MIIVKQLGHLTHNYVNMQIVLKSGQVFTNITFKWVLSKFGKIVFLAFRKVKSRVNIKEVLEDGLKTNLTQPELIELNWIEAELGNYLSLAIARVTSIQTVN